MKTRITDLLGIEYPIIQGGMAWVAEYHLAAAVANGASLDSPEVVAGIQGFGKLIIGALGIFLLGVLAQWGNARLMLHISTNVLFNIRTDLFKKFYQKEAFFREEGVLDNLKEIKGTKENIFELWRNIQVEGAPDSSVPGTYETKFYVIDAAGNKSNEAVLTFVVD